MMCQTKCVFLTLRIFSFRTPNKNNKQPTDVPCCVLPLARAASSGIEVPRTGTVLTVVIFRGVVFHGVDFCGFVFSLLSSMALYLIVLSSLAWSSLVLSSMVLSSVVGFFCEVL